MADGNVQYSCSEEGLDPEREVRSLKDVGEFGDLAKLGCISWDTS
jgi:hypothetical protein